MSSVAVKNEKKQVIREEYRNADNKRAIQSQLGYCIVEKEYDAAGNVSMESYFGPDKNPQRTIDGYTLLRREYDDNKHITRESYFVLGEAPAEEKSSEEETTEENSANAENTTPEGKEEKEKEEAALVELPYKLAKGYASLTRTYDEAGNVLVETYFDEKGTETACADGYSRWVRAYDDNKKVTSESFQDAADALVIKKSTGYAKVEYTYDDNGNKLTESYFGADGNPVMATRGCAGVQYTYNSMNKCTQELYVDLDGKAVALATGYAGISREYDENGALISTANLDANGKPVTTAAGYNGMQTTYDDAGRKTEEFFVDGRGKLIDSEKGYAKMTHTYDEDTGLETETRYYNAEGDPVMVTGAARIEYEYDSAGNKTVTRKYDAADQLLVDDDGVAYTQIEYDAFKRPSRETFIGEDGSPLFAESKGYATLTKEYDYAGNIVLQKYYDTYDNPVVIPAGYAGLHTDYDTNKKPVREEYLNTGGSLARPSDVKKGYSAITYQRDEKGNVLLESYFDQNDNPIESASGYAAVRKGYAAVRKTYNDQNKPVKTEYLGTDGERTAITNGTSAVINEYDANGNMIRESYEDEEGNQHAIQSENNKDPQKYYSYVEIRKTYDEQNKLIEEAYFDADGDPAKCASQFSIKRNEYDELGRQTLTAWFTTNDEPYVNDKGYASMATTYAADGSKTDTYYDANGNEVTVEQ